MSQAGRRAVPNAMLICEGSFRVRFPKLELSVAVVWVFGVCELPDGFPDPRLTSPQLWG